MNPTQKRNLIFLVAGKLISVTGSGMQMIAVPLYILDKTNSGALMGIYSMICIAPSLLAAPLAGVLGDRWNRKIIMIYADILRAAIVGALAVFAYSGIGNIAILFIAQVVLSSLDSLFNASADGILPDMIEHEHLPNANALKGATEGVSMVIGPVVGGVIYGVWGMKVVFLVNAISFLISGFCELLIKYNWAIKAKDKLSLKIVISEVKEALRFVLGHKGLKQLASFSMLLNFLVIPIFYVVVPFTFKKVMGFSSQQTGYLMSFFMVGFFAGNVVVGALFSKVKTEKLMKAGLFGEESMFILLAIVSFPVISKGFDNARGLYFGVLAVLMAGIGIFNVFASIPIQTNIQKLVNADMRSRFFSIFGVFTQLIVPVGSFVYGILLDRIEVNYILLSISIIVFFLILRFVSVATMDVYEPHIANSGVNEGQGL